MDHAWKHSFYSILFYIHMYVRTSTNPPARVIDKYMYIQYVQKKLSLPFNGTERNRSFRSRLIIFHYPFTIRSRSVRIFSPF